MEKGKIKKIIDDCSKLMGSEYSSSEKAVCFIQVLFEDLNPQAVVYVSKNLTVSLGEEILQDTIESYQEYLHRHDDVEYIKTIHDEYANYLYVINKDSYLLLNREVIDDDFLLSRSFIHLVKELFA